MADGGRHADVQRRKPAQARARSAGDPLQVSDERRPLISKLELEAMDLTGVL
jgi:hypothetical protein